MPPLTFSQPSLLSARTYPALVHPQPRNVRRLMTNCRQKLGNTYDSVLPFLWTIVGGFSGVPGETEFQLSTEVNCSLMNPFIGFHSFPVLFCYSSPLQLLPQTKTNCIYVFCFVFLFLFCLRICFLGRWERGIHRLRHCIFQLCILTSLFTSLFALHSFSHT